jgi:hypothetical protein
MKNKIDFLCVGAQKSGTTTLRAYLRQHPQLNVPGDELHCFDNERHDWDGKSWQHDYHRKFMSQASEKLASLGGQSLADFSVLAGEVTPIYMYWRPSLQRIFKYNPNIKLIFVLRNPMHRAYSHWAMECARGAEVLSFSEAIRQECIRCAEALPLQHRVYSYVDRGFYFRQISRFFDHFPSTNILILSAEAVFNNPCSALEKISSFLEISPFMLESPLYYRRGIYSKPLCIDDWNYIYDRLSEDINLLAGLVDWDLSSWHVAEGCEADMQDSLKVSCGNERAKFHGQDSR